MSAGAPLVGGVVPGQGLAPACAAIPHIAEADPGPWLVRGRPGPAHQLLPGLPHRAEAPRRSKPAAPEYKDVESKPWFFAIFQS